MNIYFFVQLEDTDLHRCRWLRFHERTPAGAISHGAFEDALSAAEGNHLVVFAPSTDVYLASIELKAKSHRQMIAAVPYMLEDELSEDVDGLHFALSTRNKKEGKQLVGVISDGLIAKLYTAISEHSFLSAAVVPLTLSIPYADGSWSLFIQDDMTTLRTGEFQGYGIDSINLDEILSVETAAYRQQHDQDVDVVKYDFRVDPGHQDTRVEGEPAAGGESEALALIGRYWLDHQGILNLLQGSYQIKTQMPGTLKQWVIAASLMVISLLLYLTNTAITNQQLSAQNQQLVETMSSIYTELFHEEPAGDPAVAMRKKHIGLQGSQGGPVSPFLHFVAASGKVILSDRESRIIRMSYNNKQMNIDIETSAFDKLEALQQQIESNTILVDLKAVTNQLGKINGRLVLAEVKH